jgi:DNA repair exonuclease SbcCD ATPase subunit
MLKTLAVRNVRGVVSADIALSERVTLIVGQMGAGKSSLAAGIQYALAGNCAWTAADGKGFAGLIRNGAAGATIEVETDFGSVLRTITAKQASVAVGERSGKEAQAVLDTALPAPDILAAMLRSDGLTGLPAKGQQDLLFQLAGGEVNGQWFTERLTADEAAAVEVQLATRLRGSGLAQHLYDAAYAMRTEANRTLKTAQTQLQAANDAGASAHGNPTLIGNDLNAARTELATITERLGGARATISAHERATQRVNATEATLGERRKQFQAIGPAPEVMGSEALLALLAELDELETAATSHKEHHDQARAERDALCKQVASFKALAGCVLSGVDCPLSGDDREKAVAAADKQARRLTEQMAAAEAAREQADTEADALRVRANAVGDAHVRLEHWTERQTLLAASVAEDEQAAAAALADYQDCGTVSLADLEHKAETVKARITALEGELRTAQGAEQAAGRRAALESDVAAATQRADLLDSLVKKLSPDGLPAQAMRETVGAVLAGINEVLAEVSEFILHAEPGKEFSLLVDTPKGRVQVSGLSKGETLLFGAAVQVALARLTGFGFVIVDDTDALDDEHRGLLVGMLLDSDVQALVLARPSNGSRPVAEGLAVYDLVDGKAVAADAAMGGGNNADQA